MIGSLKAESNAARKYGELIEKIEIMSKFVCIALTKITVSAGFISASLVTVINYFVYDLENESFFLTLPLL